MGVVGLALMSQITIPIHPVPITLQTVAVLFIGLTYNRRDAFLTMATYLALGVLGVPVFAAYKSGLVHLLSPVGGYYIGFLAAVVMMASVREKWERSDFIADISLSLLGSAVIYALGVLWLSKFIGINAAFMGGVVPFMIPGAVKAFMLTGLLKYVR
jgi:biotin transport system substrate-specific component